MQFTLEILLFLYLQMFALFLQTVLNFEMFFITFLVVALIENYFVRDRDI